MGPFCIALGENDLAATRAGTARNGGKRPNSNPPGERPRARAGGATLLQFTTNAARTDAQRFYQRLGFTPSHIGFKKTL